MHCMIIIILITIGAIIYLAINISWIHYRNDALNAWALEICTKELNSEECGYLIELWNAYKSKIIPEKRAGSVTSLPSQEWDHLRLVSLPLFRPPIFSAGKKTDYTLWLSVYLRAKNIEYNDLEAIVIAGLIFNRYEFAIEAMEDVVLGGKLAYKSNEWEERYETDPREKGYLSIARCANCGHLELEHYDSPKIPSRCYRSGCNCTKFQRKSKEFYKFIQNK